MSKLRIHLFGRLHVDDGERRLSGFRGAKVQELLAYLLLHRHRPHPRETLAGFLFNGSSTASSKKHLRQTLWQLQTALHGSEPEDGQTFLVNEPEWIGVELSANVWLDVADLEAAYRQAEGVPGRRLEASQAARLKSAVEHYTGDLLDGCYEDWCLFERERLQNEYLAILNKLISYSESHGEYESGLGYATRILHLDHAQERAHRRMMRLHWLRGDRTSALRQYAACRRALSEELGVEPATETTDLYDKLCQASPEIALPVERPYPEPLPPASELVPGPLPNLFQGLRQLETDLEQLLGHVRRELRSVEKVLDLRS